MLEAPISNMGVRGIRKAAQRAQQWPDVLDEKELRYTMFNTYIFIDAKGGQRRRYLPLYVQPFPERECSNPGDA